MNEGMGKPKIFRENNYYCFEVLNLAILIKISIAGLNAKDCKTPSSIEWDFQAYLWEKVISIQEGDVIPYSAMKLDL